MFDMRYNARGETGFNMRGYSKFLTVDRRTNQQTEWKAPFAIKGPNPNKQADLGISL